MSSPYNKKQVSDGWEDLNSKRPHTFHIPVMGTGFTIDTPLKVARYGISSVISLGDDRLIEQLRKFHCDQRGILYQPILEEEDDSRARRITAYLNFVNAQVREQFQLLQEATFEPGSEITRYFEMLPDSPLKLAYDNMLTTSDLIEKVNKQTALRRLISPGSIDVNIMTKVDHDQYRDGVRLPAEYALAMSSLRGYARSNLNSSIILSAGLNRRLFNYISKFDDFFPDHRGVIKKKIVLKVSDFRSAVIQGKLLAKLGLWVSEYRIESGLNCGGHAFATKGNLMGPILEEFRRNKQHLVEQLLATYMVSLKAIKKIDLETPSEVRITFQGGIITAEENSFIMKYYKLDGTGWGTPFLLVPEVTNVDENHLKKLAGATAKDICLSENSPLGVLFWSMNNSASERLRRLRILKGSPGSSCPKGYLKSDTEFSHLPLCPASRLYQRRKIKQISDNGFNSSKRGAYISRVMKKSCICNDLAGGVLVKNGIDPEAHPAICCGPGIVNFSQVTTLEKMIDHIYGRVSLLNGPEPQYIFIKELSLYVDYLRLEIEKTSKGTIIRTASYFDEFKNNLADGIEYYRNLAEQFGKDQKECFIRELEKIWRDIENIIIGIKALPAV
ncbi:MAG: hypothetical protein PHU88_12830 [candidate division Zixibacteria bacterium]|nr:hypothetical protein [candidate division Zixibacteria bacterium]MDD5425755.1 hypothetical protein [candidate division Zixibacteria bacterium]